jgi:hypothetical protein
MRVFLFLFRVAEQGPNKAVAFVGPFDATMRSGCGDTIQNSMLSLFRAAADKVCFFCPIAGHLFVSS